MPDQITVSEFIAETNEDYKAPTASNFTTRMSHCRNTVTALEEVSIRPRLWLPVKALKFSLFASVGYINDWPSLHCFYIGQVAA